MILKHETKITVRYGETDKMGVVYHGNYPLYLEIGRTELIRNLGISYKSLEEQGIMLPVIELNIKYIKPAFYDEVLTIVTTVKEIPTVRIYFDYEIFNQKNQLLSTANTTLVFIDSKTRKPCKVPDKFIKNLNLKQND